MSESKKAPPDTPEANSRFYIIFDQLQNLDAIPETSEVSMDEIEEIEQIRRIVAEITDDPPRFLTST
jgi:hypothetical protein